MPPKTYGSIAQVQGYLRLPVLERIRRWVCAHPPGTQLTTSVRQLARLIGCGAAMITPALRRMAADGFIDHLTAPSGTLIEVLVSDAPGGLEGDRSCDHGPSRLLTQSAAEVIEPTITESSDRANDHPRGNKELYLDQDMQQQHACERDFAVAEEPPAELTLTEWATIRALVPGYDEDQLKADLAKLKQRPGIHNPVGVLIAAYRRGEPIWGRDDLQAHNAAVTAQHVSPAADPPAPKRQRSDRAPAAPAAAPSNPAQFAPHGALWDLLLLLMPDAGLVDWLCDGFALEVRPDATVLHCRSADHALVARDLRGLLVDAFRDLGLPDQIEIHAPEGAEQAVRDAEQTPVADHVAAPVPSAPAQLVAAPAQPPTPPTPPASTAPPAYSVPPGITDRPRRPRFSPWRAS
jgi:hypothetical protein